MIAVPHNHEVEEERIDEARLKGQLVLKSVGEAAKEYDEKIAPKTDQIILEEIV